MSEYLVPFEDAESEFVEKRSRFISHVWRVESEAEARARIEEMKKRYYDARHNCWCYILKEGGVVRYSDDGEPQGTAGQPMLNVPAGGGHQCLLCGHPIFRRRSAGSGRLDPGLYKRCQGCPGCRGHLPDEPLDRVGRALHLSAV